MKKYWLSLLLCFSMLLIAAPSFADNVVVNPSFDTDYEGWSVWTPRGEPEVTVDEEIWHSAPGALRITGFADDDRGSVGQRVPVQGGTMYTFRVWMKTENVSKPVARVRLQFNPAATGADKTRPHMYFGSLQGTHDWTLFEESFLVPEGTETITIEPFLDSAQGIAWWDDLELKPADSK